MISLALPPRTGEQVVHEVVSEYFWGLPPRVVDKEPIIPWSKRKVVVTQSERPGYYNPDPYQVAPLEDYANSEVKRIILMWSSQLGKTLVEAAMCSYTIDQEPQGMLFMHASDKGLKKFIREKLDPVILSDPGMYAKVERNNRNALPIDGFTFGLGGFCTMTTAGSKSSKHGTSASRVIADEIDDYEDKTVVGSLVQRSITFSDTKLVLASTPTLHGNSPIEVEFLAGSQSEWYVHCPHCEHPQVLGVENIPCHLCDNEAEAGLQHTHEWTGLYCIDCGVRSGMKRSGAKQYTKDTG